MFTALFAFQGPVSLLAAAAPTAAAALAATLHATAATVAVAVVVAGFIIVVVVVGDVDVDLIILASRAAQRPSLGISKGIKERFSIRMF